MQRSKIHRAALIAAAMLILSFGAGTKGFAQANSPQPAKNIWVDRF